MRPLLPLLLLSLSPVFAERPEAPRHLLGVSEPLTAASSAAPEDIALDHLRRLVPDLLLGAVDLDGVYIAKRYRTGHNGVTHIVLRQRFQDADVLNAEWVVNVDRDGRVLNAGGNLFAAPGRSVSLPARVRAMAAARSAVAAVNPELAANFTPFESAEATRARHGIRFSRGPLARDVEGAAVWYSVRGELRPAWNFFVADADRVHRYSVTVDDSTQSILEQQPLTFFQSPPAAPRGLVFSGESPQPNPTPGVRLTVAPPLAPRVMQSFKGDPVASPMGWTNGTETAGNNVIAGENLAGIGFVRPTPTQAADGNFSFPLQLGPGFHPLDYRDAATTNLFYWMNRAHDLHYQYGFDEQSGNFQADNLGRGGVGGDALFAYSHFGAQSLGAGQFENAFFSLGGSEDDGAQPEVAMFISGAVGALGDFFTDGSYDSLVMVHEYTHGVSFRLARQVYTTFQGASMGEAWSDFYGLEYTTPDGGPADGIYPIGQYFDQSWGYGGARLRPYSTNMELNPITFADIGHVRSGPEVHADGEIWMEALWEIRANLIKQFGEQEGRKRVRQLVMDGMKLAVPAASMVDMRDAILLADRVDYKGASQSQLWAGFAKRGLGALAYSDGGATTHVAASFDLPSTTGAIRFYDDPIVIGEVARIVLQDSNYRQSTVQVQVTGSSGDLENVILHQRGSIYVGTIGTGVGTVTRQDRFLELVPGDFISAYYVDRDAGGAGKLALTTIATMLSYQVSGAAPAYSFAGEQRNTLIGTSLRFPLPFSFPFFDKQYMTAIVYRNGLIAFDTPVATSACTDLFALRKYIGVAPLWLPLSLSGTAQDNEGLYVSSTSDSMTFRWAGEFTAVGQRPSPVNFAATLFRDGRIQYNYGSGNQAVLTRSDFSQCGVPVTGVSNGHDVYSASVLISNYENQATLRFEPPFNFSSLPNAIITMPRSGDHVQDILRINGTASDSATSVRSVDIFVDGVQRARVVPTGFPLTWSTALNLTGTSIGPGDHSLSIRVTNGRGGFSDLPVSPLTFTVDPGNGLLPVVSLQQPADEDIVKGTLRVMGYAYNADLRITNVDTLIDGFVYGITSYGATRNDVCDPLAPKPSNCPAVGFIGNFNTLEGFPPIPDGPHKLQIRVRDQTGRFIFYPETPIQITVRNGPAAKIAGVLESPAPNDKLSGTITVSGYVYSPGRRITSGTLLVDGLSYGAIRLAQLRPDVCAALPDADACPNIGFTVTLDTHRLLNGPHIVGIRVFNDRGDSDTFPHLVNGGINVFVQN